uniref:Uncharacterized protein LOC110194747 isoform X3 n=1 Tax=Phascolarctos cinereus TaxID=38626 RepID=A0A6P5IWI8_PHACI|nr:uncharacterized protein LOC110194747 isoform X3 [Phascolarctos cinereus]
MVPVRYAFQRGAREQQGDDARPDFVFHIPSRSFFPEHRNDDIGLRPLGPPPAYSPPFDFRGYDDETSDESCSDLDFGDSCFFSPIHLPELVSDQPRGEPLDASPPRHPRQRLARDEASQNRDFQRVLPGASAAVRQGIPDYDQGAVAYHCCRDAVSRAGRRRPASPQPQEDPHAPPCPRCGLCHVFVSPQFLCGTYCQCRRQDQECCVLCMPMVCPDQPAQRSVRALRGGEFREQHQAFSVRGPRVAEALVNLPTADCLTGPWNSYLAVTPDLLISDHFTGHAVMLGSDTYALIIIGLRISLVLVLCGLISSILHLI